MYWSLVLTIRNAESQMSAYIICSPHYNLRQTSSPYFTLNSFFKEGRLPATINLQSYLWFKKEYVILYKVDWIFIQQRGKNGRETSMQGSSECLISYTGRCYQCCCEMGQKFHRIYLYMWKVFSFSFKSLSWIKEENSPVRIDTIK